MARLQARRWWLAELASVAACIIPATLILLIYVRNVPASLLWDAESYFITARRFSDTFPYIPTLSFRAFGYPAFLRLFHHGDTFDIGAIIIAQKIIFVGSVVLVYFIARSIVGFRAFAIVAAILYSLNIRIMMHANSIMVETLAVFLELSFILCFVKSTMVATRHFEWLSAASLLLLAAIFVRPTFIAALPVVLIWIFIGDRQAGVGWTHLLPRKIFRAAGVTACIAIPLLAYAGYNYYKVGHFKTFQGAGFSSLNYPTNPCFFLRMSNKVAYIRDTLIKFQENKFPELGDVTSLPRCNSWFSSDRGRMQIHWGNTFDLLRAAFKQHYGINGLEWDTLAMRITKDAIMDRPLEYLRIWSQVSTEFWTAHDGVDGFYQSVQDVERHHTVFDGKPGEGLVMKLKDVYRVFIAPLSLPIVILAVALAALAAPLRMSTKGRTAILFVVAYCLVYAAMSTALEAGSQSRYRIPIDPLIYVCLAFIVGCGVEFAASARARLEGRRVTQGTSV